MEASQASTRTKRRRGGSATLEDVTENAGEAAGDPAAPAAAPGPAPAAPAQGEAPVSLPVLPKVKTSSEGILEDKTTLLYGPAGIGKSTLASEWAGGNMFFFDCAGELNDLEVYRSGVDGQPPITDWTTFRSYAASIQEVLVKEPGRFAGTVIDTADVLGMYCAQHIRKSLGVVHQSDAEWGKGWDMLKEAWASHLAKLAALPGGTILVSHSKDKTIKKGRREWERSVPTLTGGVLEVTTNMADLVLFVDWASDDEADEKRVIFTKPSQFHEAKERGKVPRLPAEIEWPVGRSGWDVLREAWYENDNAKGA